MAEVQPAVVSASLRKALRSALRHVASSLRKSTDAQNAAITQLETALDECVDSSLDQSTVSSIISAVADGAFASSASAASSRRLISVCGRSLAAPSCRFSFLHAVYERFNSVYSCSYLDMAFRVHSAWFRGCVSGEFFKNCQASDALSAPLDHLDAGRAGSMRLELAHLRFLCAVLAGASAASHTLEALQSVLVALVCVWPLDRPALR